MRQGYTVSIMNRYIFLPVILCVLFVSGAFVSAQTTTPGTTTESTPPVTPTPRTFVTEPTLQKIAQNRLLNLAANMSNRMDSAVARLQNVIDRLTTRLDIMLAEGANVTPAMVELALAQNSLDEAKRNLENIDVEVNAFTGSATPRENWGNLKKTYLSTRDAIVTAHQSILATINLAQTAGVAPEPTTSTTTAPTTNN